MDTSCCYNIVTRLREAALKQKKVEVRNMENKMIESALKKNGYYFDFDNKVLTVTKEFAEKAGDIDSTECEMFLKLRNRVPGVTMKVRETKSGKKLTYSLMLKYIVRMPNAVELVQEYERAKLRSKSQKSPYKYVTDWFEAKFPNYDKALIFDEEGNVDWAAVMKKEDSEEGKSADNVVEMPMAAGM